MADENSTAFVPGSGMTATHFRVVQELAKSEKLIVVVRNTNTASTPLIEQGCPGKPMAIKSNTSPVTGVVTAANPAEVKLAYAAGYYVMDADGVARREVTERGKTVKHELKLDRPFWKSAANQIIDPMLKKPLVGDYDLHGVIDPKSTGQNIALATKDGVALANRESPLVAKFRAKANQMMKGIRMFHGAQDQYAGFRGGATVFMPDGTVQFHAGEAGVKGFYETIGRQTITGSYNPVPKISGLKRAGAAAKGIAQNQDAMAMLGQLLGAGLQWLGDIGIQNNVEKRLKTDHAKGMAANFARGNGVLVIIHMQEWAIEDFNGMRGRALLGVSIEGGVTQEAALKSWRDQPKLLPGAAEGWRAYDRYMWIDPPQ